MTDPLNTPATTDKFSLPTQRLQEMRESVAKAIAVAKHTHKTAEGRILANWLKSGNRLNLTKSGLLEHLKAKESRARATGELAALVPLHQLLGVMLEQRHPASPCTRKSAWPVQRLADYLSARAFGEARKSNRAGREVLRTFIREYPDSIPFLSPLAAPADPQHPFDVRLALFEKIVARRGLTPQELKKLKHFLML